MHTRRIVVIGASAGGLDALRQLVSDLPADFAAPIGIVVHCSPESPGVVDSILTRAGRLPAQSARDRARLEPGRIYVAPPDYHLLVEPGILRVTKGPRENRFRPAIDPLFRSAAQVFGPAAIGVILSGNLDDGTAGLWTIKALGGTAVVQDPDDAMFPAMPESAIHHVAVDQVVPAREMASLLVQLTAAVVEPVTVEPPASLEVEVKIAKEEKPLEAGFTKIASPSVYSCPECHGVLMQLREGDRIRFRCHTGHGYTMETLLADLSNGIEESLWNAIRALEEGDLLLRGMAEHLKSSHNGAGVERLLEQAEATRRQTDTIRKLVMEREPLLKS